MADWFKQVSIGLTVALVGFAAAAIWAPTKAWLASDLPLLGWGLVAIAAAVLFIGFALGFWRGRGASSMPIISAATAAAKPSPKGYAPTELEEGVIRVLRSGDTLAMTAADIAFFLGGGNPVSDVDQAARRLLGFGFLRDYLQMGRGQSFRLDDPGLDHARAKGYTVAVGDVLARMRNRIGG